MGIKVTGRNNISKNTEKYKEISSKSADIPKDLHYIILLNGCNKVSRKIYIYFSFMGGSGTSPKSHITGTSRPFTYSGIKPTL